MVRPFGRLAVMWAAGLLAACSVEEKPQGPRFGAAPSAASGTMYRFAVHPLHNPGKLVRAYQPLVDYLNHSTATAQFSLRASRDYAAFERKVERREADVILPNPWQTLQAMEHGYHVIAMAGEPADFKGIFIVRADSGITDPEQLKGHVVTFPARTALAACILPQYFLHSHGIDVAADIDNHYVGSQESSILSVFMGLSAAGATWPPPWRAFQHDRPDEASQLRVAWETESLVNNSVMVRDEVPAAVQAQLRTQLVSLSTAPGGKEILDAMETARFLPASDSDYDIVREYVARFEREVRPVEEP